MKPGHLEQSIKKSCHAHGRLYTGTKAIVLIAKHKETAIVIATNMEKNVVQYFR